MGAYLEVWGVMGRQVSVLECDNVLIGRADINDITLREDGNQLAIGDGVVDETHGAFTRHGERHERIRKQHRVPQR